MTATVIIAVVAVALVVLAVVVSWQHPLRRMEVLEALLRIDDINDGPRRTAAGSIARAA